MRAMPAGFNHVARVLVVDPDGDTRSLYRESLRQVGCEIVEATNGREALVEALVHPPAVVVAEARLPFVDGYALCDILRRDRVTRAARILVVTAEARAGEFESLRAAGADAVLVKPVTPDALLNQLHRLLDRQPESSRPPEGPSPLSEQRRTSQAKAHLRGQTTTPPAPPPQLTCPSCDRPLTYKHSYVGGVSRRYAEQWDIYRCPASCGTFEYRQRTRKLRRVGQMSMTV